MAIYFLNLKTFGRSNGSGAVSAAAYRAGERIRDERTGRTYDHTDRQDVMHKEIVLPSEFSSDAVSWARDRAHLWNAAESAESRINARVAREYLVALPAELSAEQQVNLARGFSYELADRYRFAVDLAIHEPRRFPGSDPRNFHAHLLATTREVGVDGLGAKTTLEWADSRRREIGLGPAINELLHVRERWANVANEALQEAHLTARIDHRSLQAQGIDREPRPYLPKPVFEMERHGYRTTVGERMREDYQLRVEARQARAADHQPQAPNSADYVRDSSVSVRKNTEDVRREARENWLRMRENASQKSLDGQKSLQGQKSLHGQKSLDEKSARARDDDFSR